MRYTIDMGGKLPFSVQIDGDKLHIKYDLSAIKSERLKQFLYDNLMLVMEENAAPQGRSNLVAPFSLKNAYSISLKQKTLLEFHLDEAQNIIVTSPPYMRLSVMEIRMLAQNSNCAVPYDRINLPPYANQSWHIKTDLHTHLTSQIGAHDLLEIACTYGALYPTELLEMLNINTRNYATTLTPSTPFAPAAQDGLECEQYGKMVDGIAISALALPDLITLKQAMEIAIDEVICFDDLERRIYRFRNPLTKNPALIGATIARIAHDYVAHGVEYAELAVTAALNPDWLQAALPALMEAQMNGVTLKLLIGLPRSLPPSQILMQLKMVMFAASHPAIIGVDFLGYESNKTRNFAWALTQFARFAASNKQEQDFIIRVHAGENGKNPDNVAEVLQIAEAYGVRVRVGHATYGDADSSLELAQKLAANGLLIMEFNPDSNLAMNNIDCATDLPINKWAAAGIPFVLSSDGGGVYQTDATQLFNAGIFAGLGASELALMMQTEAVHMQHQAELDKRKTQAFAVKYGDDTNFIAHMREFQATLAHQQQHFNFNGKVPLLIAGASGSSWRRISPTHQAEICAGIEQLVAMLDANKVAFVVGRIKPEGIGKVLDDALTKLYASKNYVDNSDAVMFDVAGLLSQQQNMPMIASHINHILPLHGELMSMPTQVTNLLKTHGGLAIYVGGSAFTRDFILCSQNLEVPFAVMADVAGASGEKARILSQEHIFMGAVGMVEWVKNQGLGGL